MSSQVKCRVFLRKDKDMSIGFFGAGALVVTICALGIMLTYWFTRKNK